MGLFGIRDREPLSAELREILGDYELPSFPRVAMNVLRDLRDPETRIESISSHIELDPGLHAQVLRTTNSAAFGLSRKVGDLQHAIALLGRGKLESIVVAAAVRKALPPRAGHGFDDRRFWIHCARRAALARGACSTLAPKDAPEALTAGLLQDLAVPVFVMARGRQYVDLYHEWGRGSGGDLAEMERETFGFDHAQVGARIARAWELSDQLCELVLEHHMPSPDGVLSTCVGLGAAVVDRADADRTDLAGVVAERLSLEVERATEVVEAAWKAAEEFGAWTD